MEERERLIFLEKMSIKKQKDDLMTLIDELNVLKSSGRLRSPNDSRAVEPPNNKMTEDRRLEYDSPPFDRPLIDKATILAEDRVKDNFDEEDVINLYG